MDNLTHLALGAAIGQTVAGRRLGRAALMLGAIGNTLPDIDVIGNALGSLAEWQHHRGFTHSLFFGAIVGPALGYGIWRAYRRWRAASLCAEPTSLGPIITVLTLTIIAHPLLDLFTAYGTQLLAPLSDARFAIPSVPVIDPHYTLILLIALLIGWWRDRWAVATSAVALVLSTGFLLYAWEQNLRAETEARRQLAAEGRYSADLSAYPTIFQPWLRRLVVVDEDGVRVGFVSTWRPSPIRWECVARPSDPLIERARATPEVRILTRFAQGQVWPGLRRDDQDRTVVRFTDLRYGVPGATATGWWGIDVTFGTGGDVVGAERIVVPRPVLSWATVAAVFRAGLGDLSDFNAITGAPMEPGASGC